MLALVLALAAATFAPSALGAEGESEWRLEQPYPPETPVGVESSSSCHEAARKEPCVPIGLGRIGDVEFEAPNRGVLITAGNGSTIPAGLWAYNGKEWHELASVCGATEGRIAWSGSEEFWTISDGRPGQAANPSNGEPAPLADRTLCHFAHGEVVGSYASQAFQESSYQPMHAAACFSSTNCWFAGDPLPEKEDGYAFHLHWNGSSLTEEPSPWGHSVEDMRLYEGHIYESVRLLRSDKEEPKEAPYPHALHVIYSAGTPPFELVEELPLYGENEYPQALEFLHLGADHEALWAAAGPVREPPSESAHATLTVLRDEGGTWTQIIGPEAPSASAAPIEDDVVNSIAPDPGTDGAWLALDSQDDAQQVSPEASATVAYVSADGTVQTQTLPSAAETAAGVAPKGAAQQITCPAHNDCWMTTTQGWLFHLAPDSERQLPLDTSGAFSKLITYRPEDEGLEKQPPDAPPANDSGEQASTASKPSLIVIPEVPEAKVREALLSNIHSKLVHGTTLELSFHLAVKARVKLVAKRKKKVVASTPMRTFAKGNRKLLLALKRNEWPTKIALQTHALAALPLISTSAPGNNTVGTRVAELPGASSGGDLLSGLFAGALP
jgi:hypothetical protein